MSTCPANPSSQYVVLSCQSCKVLYRGDPLQPRYCPQCCRVTTCQDHTVQFPEEFAKFSDISMPSYLCNQSNTQAQKDDEDTDEQGGRAQGAKGRGKQTGKPAAKKKGKQKTGDAQKQTGDGKKKTGDAQKQTGDGKKKTGDAQKQTGDGRKQTGSNRRGGTQSTGDGNLQNDRASALSNRPSRRGRESEGDGNRQTGRAANANANGQQRKGKQTTADIEAKKSGKKKTGAGNGATSSVPVNGAVNGKAAKASAVGPTEGGLLEQRLHPSTQRMHPSSQGMHPSSQGMHPSTQGMPPGTQGMPPGTQGMPPGTQGMPPSSQGMPLGTQGMPPGMYGMAPGSQFGAPYGQQGGHPMLGAQVSVPGYAIEPYGAPAPNIRYENPASMPLGYPPQPPQAPEGQGPQGMAGYGPQGVPAAAYDQQAMLGYGTYGQGGPQAPYLYGPPVTAPYPQPGFASGQEYAGIPPGYAPPPGYGAAAPPGYPTDQAAGMPSEREPQQFDPCTGRDVCKCPAQHKIGEYCVQSNLGMDAIQRFLKSLQLSCPANGLQNCALLLPIDLDMANRTDEGDTKKGKKSSPKRRLSTGDAAGKKAASLDATKSKGSVRSSPVASPDAVSPVTSNSNDPNAATECTPVAAACPPPQPSMRSFTCNTSCQVQADDSTQTVGGTSKKNPKEYPTAYQCEPAKGPSCCNACCNGCCQSCYWPYYYYYNPYTGCYYWYPNYCNGCQNCCPKDPLEKIPEKPQPKEPAAAAAGATAAATPKAKKKNDRKMGGGPAGMSYSLSCAIPKRRTTAAAATRNMRQAIMPGYYPTSMPSDCSPYGQIGLARGRIP